MKFRSGKEESESLKTTLKKDYAFSPFLSLFLSLSHSRFLAPTKNSGQNYSGPARMSVLEVKSGSLSQLWELDCFNVGA